MAQPTSPQRFSAGAPGSRAPHCAAPVERTSRSITAQQVCQVHTASVRVHAHTQNKTLLSRPFQRHYHKIRTRRSPPAMEGLQLSSLINSVK